jgi:hypothetical protein
LKTSVSAISKSPNHQITNSRARSWFTTPVQMGVCCIGQALAAACRMMRVMTKLLNALAISTLLLVPASAANAQVSFGIHIGEPPAPRAYVVPARPGADYVWVEGYQYPEGGRYRWHNGYWTRPPYQGAYWVEPYHVGGSYYAGRWEGDHGNINHDHKWDRAKQRDERRDDRNDHR